jgi:hypothetical protein
MTETELFYAKYPNLCPHIRWRAQGFVADPNEPAPPPYDGLYWCVFSQTCIGPDGQGVDPDHCCSETRVCFGTGSVK